MVGLQDKWEHDELDTKTEHEKQEIQDRIDSELLGKAEELARTKI